MPLPMAKHALLVGVSSYPIEDAVKAVPSARRNVEALGRMLALAEVGGFASVTPLFDPDPLEMQGAIEEFFRERSPDDTALLFFSGQSWQDEAGRLYLASRLTRMTPDGFLLKHTAVPVRFLQDVMSSSPCRQQVLILDCGLSGRLDPALVAHQNGSLSLENQLGGRHRAALVAINTATGAIEHHGSDLSLYTHYLVEGLATGAADQNRDGVVSVRELHDYVNARVQASEPSLHPQIVALQDEALQIPLSQVPVLNSRRQYGEKVRQYLVGGQISVVGREILNQLRLKLRLSPAEALAIENEVLQPYREHADRLQRYRRALTAALEQEYPLGSRSLQELRDLRELFQLHDEDLIPLNQEVTAPFAARAEEHQRHLEQYRHEFQHVLSTERTISDTTRQRLRKLQATLQVLPAEVADLEHDTMIQFEQQREQYHRHLQQYRDAVVQAIKAELPLSSSTRLRLQKLQHSLQLADADVAQVEAQVNAEIEHERTVYRGHLKQYEDAFEQAITQDRMPSKPVRDYLQQLQQQYNLQDPDIIQTEREVLRQQNLKRYQEAAERLYQSLPLSTTAQEELKRLQESLMLSDDDVALIHKQLTTQARVQQQQYQVRVRQYGGEFYAAIAREFPLNAQKREQLNRRWQELGLREPDAREVERLLIDKVKKQQDEYNANLQRYEQAFAANVQTGIPITEETRETFRRLQQVLGLKESDVQEAERAIKARFEAEQVQPPPPPPPAPDPNQDDLASERGLDYQVLQDLLHNKFWKQADEETFRLMLAATGRTKEGWLNPAALDNFPCTDLNTLNQLWVKYSGGRFGFSAQQEVYQKLVLPDSGKKQPWQLPWGASEASKRAIAFAKEVKWVWGKDIYPLFKSYNTLDFSENAPKGHLPACWFWHLDSWEAFRSGTLGSTRALGGSDPIGLLSMLVKRMNECRVDKQ